MVVILHQQGLSQTKISKKTGVSRCAVQALLKKHKEMGNVEDRRRSGRPRKCSALNVLHRACKLLICAHHKLCSMSHTMRHSVPRLWLNLEPFTLSIRFLMCQMSITQAACCFVIISQDIPTRTFHS